MFNRTELLREAEVALCDREGSLKRRLAVAAEHFWAVQLFENDWPEPLQKRAECVWRQVVSNGTVSETIGAMDEDTVIQVASELVDLLEARERHLAPLSCAPARRQACPHDPLYARINVANTGRLAKQALITFRTQPRGLSPAPRRMHEDRSGDAR